MNAEFIEALNSLEKDRGIPKDVLLNTIEDAVLAAYKKNYGPYHKVRVLIDSDTGTLMVLIRREIVEVVEGPNTQMSLDEAHEIDPRYEVGDYIEYQVMPKEFGRVAAQTAKQVVVQRIREKEREIIFERYQPYLKHIITGRIHRKTARTVFVSLDGTEGIMPFSEQVKGENYQVGDVIKAYVFEVKKTYKGPQVFLSRSHPGFIRGLFELEIPEIEDGTVKIMNIAREAGSRTKITVATDFENVDPIGACVGNRGLRVQHIADEIYGEKIDIIEWSSDPETLISNVLSPATVSKVIIHSIEEQIATVVVTDSQLSLAIGKEGQNVRLAARVSGWKIDIKSESQYGDIADDDDFVDDDLNYVDDLEHENEDINHDELADSEKSDDSYEDEEYIEESEVIEEIEASEELETLEETEEFDE